MTGEPRLVFDAASGTIERRDVADGGSFLADGFQPGQTIRVSGSDRGDSGTDPNNNGTFTLAAVSDGVLTLVASDVLVDETGSQGLGITIAGPSTFRVDAANASPSASRLAILRSDATADATGDGNVDYRDVDGLIRGGVIGGVSLLDRFFLEDTAIFGSLRLGTGDGEDVVISGDFGFVEILASGGPDFEAGVSIGIDGGDDGRLTLAELIDGLGDPLSLIGTPQIGGPKLAGSPQLTFTPGDGASVAATIVRAAGSGSWVDEGFQPGKRVLVDGSGSNDGSYVVEQVTAATLTLALEETLVGESVAGVAVSGEVGTFAMGLTVEPGIPGLIDDGDLPGLRVTVYDLGNPIGVTLRRRRRAHVPERDHLHARRRPARHDPRGRQGAGHVAGGRDEHRQHPRLVRRLRRRHDDHHRDRRRRRPHREPRGGEAPPRSGDRVRLPRARRLLEVRRHRRSARSSTP